MQDQRVKTSKSTALVMSGGGARGAYEIGILRGICEALGLGPEDPAPFGIMSGTSVGSINASWLAAYAHKGDYAKEILREQWLLPRIEDYIDIDPTHLLLRIFGKGDPTRQSLLSPKPFIDFANSVPWDLVHKNLDDDTLRALIFTATELSSGRSVWFTQMGGGHTFPDWPDHRRTVKHVRMGADHLLAGSAIPIALPPREIDGVYYCDGGVRFKTPIGAAIRAGAEKLVVITLRNPRTTHHAPPGESAPRPQQMIQQIMKSLSYDSSIYDVERLERINALVDVMDERLDDEQRSAVDDSLSSGRGTSWSKLPVMSFHPEFDFGERALAALDRMSPRLGKRQRILFNAMIRSNNLDGLSFLLFDPEFTEDMYEQGRVDAAARAEEIVDFLG